MKKFTKIFICLMICVFCFGLVSCGKKADNFVYPKASEQTVGNGGMVVKKGNYIYFVNGYLSATEDNLKDKNKKHNVGALMVLKLDDNGEIVLNDEDLLNDEYYRVMCDRLCGYEATGLYIFGEYLYFTSPCLENKVNDNGDEVWAYDRVDFNRIKLDNSGKVEKLYTSKVENTNVEYNFYTNGANTILLVFEKGDDTASNRLVRIDAGNKGGEQQVSKKVSSVVLKSENQSNLGENIFFVYNNEDKYQLKKYNVFNQQTTDYGQAVEDKLEVKFVAANYVYIIKPHGSNSDLCRFSISDETATSHLLFVPTDTNKIYLATNGNGVVEVIDNLIQFYGFAGSSSISPLEPGVRDNDCTTISVIAVIEEMVIYSDNNNKIKLVDMRDGNIITVTTVDDLDTSCFDFDEEYVYLLKTVGSNKYLHRVSISPAKDDVEMLGVYEENDIPTTEEAES